MRNIRSSLRLAMVLLIVGLLVGSAIPHLWASDAPEAPQIHVVATGETLWDLAQSYAPDDDPRKFVYEVQRLNGLEDPVIVAGEELRIPGP